MIPEIVFHSHDSIVLSVMIVHLFISLQGLTTEKKKKKIKVEFLENYVPATKSSE